MQRIGVWIPTESLRPGDIVELIGPSADGTLGAQSEPGARRVAVPLNAGEMPGGDGGASEQGPAGTETPGVFVATRPLRVGLNTVSVRIRDGHTGEIAAGAAPAAQVWLNTPPRPAVGLMPQAALVSGRMRFDFVNPDDGAIREA